MTEQEIAALNDLLREAYHHVYRQQHHGKHEQDRIDAKAWLAKYESWHQKPN